MTIDEVQQQIIEEFSVFDDWLDKYQYIVDLGNSLEAFPPDQETDENLIEGCQSKVWIISQYTDGKVFFQAKSDAVIVKGIVVSDAGTIGSDAVRDIRQQSVLYR